MLGKEITYKDLDGNPITEKFWFHLSRGEMAEMALAKEGRAGGFDTYIRRLIESQDGEVLIATFKEIILSTLGVRSDDNKYFEKNDAYTRRFVQSDAYSVLILELLTDADKMSEFINGVMPKDMQDEVAAATKEVAGTPAETAPSSPSAPVVAPEPKDDRPDWMKDPNRIPTQAELKGATQEQMLEAFRRQSANAGPVTQEQLPPQ